MSTITIQQATNERLLLKFEAEQTDELGNPVSYSVINITGATVKFVAKKSRNDSDADAVINKTVAIHTNASAGETEIILDTADTANAGRFEYQITIQDTTNGTRRADVGVLIIEANV